MLRRENRRQVDMLRRENRQQVDMLRRENRQQADMLRRENRQQVDTLRRENRQQVGTADRQGSQRDRLKRSETRAGRRQKVSGRRELFLAQWAGAVPLPLPAAIVLPGLVRPAL